MADLRLTLAINDYDHVRDLVTRRVRAEGIDLTWLTLSAEEIFYRFTGFRQWGVSWLSMAEYASLVSSGDRSVTRARRRGKRPVTSEANVAGGFAGRP